MGKVSVSEAGALSAEIAIQIEAMLRRNGHKRALLQEATGKSEPYLRRRLSGEQALSTNDIEAIAAALEIPAHVLVKRAEDAIIAARELKGPLPLTPAQLAAIANGYEGYELVAANPDDQDDTDAFEGA